MQERAATAGATKYFSNCLGGCSVQEIRAGDLIGKGGFTVAARAVRKSIEQFKRDVLHCAEEWVQRYAFASCSQSVQAVRKSIEQFKRDVVGGFEIGMVLPKHEMDAFAAHFNLGFKCSCSIDAFS